MIALVQKIHPCVVCVCVCVCVCVGVNMCVFAFLLAGLGFRVVDAFRYAPKKARPAMEKEECPEGNDWRASHCSSFGAVHAAPVVLLATQPHMA